ncbi:MAG: helix-turn-helix transcriptional regulator, partial [Bacteroidota bacterium]
TQRVKELTDGELQLTEGALYPTLHKLEAQAWLTVEKTRVNGRVRKYYLLSDLGREQTQDLLAEFRQFVLSVNRIFQLKLDQ